MDSKLLRKIGLSEPQAKAYRALVVKKGLKPAQLAKLTGESRANCYAILDKLVELGLAYREDVEKKLTYFPESPQALQNMVAARLAEEQKTLAKLQKQMPQMMTAFHETDSKPKVTHHSGVNEINEMYDAQTKQDDKYVRFVRSIHDVGFLGFPAMQNNRYKAINAKKRRLGITPPTFWSKRQSKDRDDATALKRRWLPRDSYTSPVEWVVSGDEIQIIVFKDEGVGVTINHPVIAESFRQLFDEFYKVLPTDSDKKHMII